MWRGPGPQSMRFESSIESGRGASTERVLASPAMADRDSKEISELLQTVDAATLAAVKVPSQDEIRQALERSRTRLREAVSSPRAAPTQTRVRYR